MREAGTGKVRVLVIDDDDLIRDTLLAILLRGGFEVMVANGGRELEQQLASFTPDVLITDIFMPHMDGIEVIRSVRQDYPDVKIIAMSGLGHVENTKGKPMMLEMAKVLGATASIRKPFRPEDLLDVMSDILSD